MTSCSGGGSQSVPEDGVFGKLPSIYYNGVEKGYELMNKMLEATSESDQQKIAEDIKALKEQTVQDATAAFEELKEKEVAVEIAEGIPFKLTSPMKFTELKSAEYGKLEMEAEMEFTADVADFKKDDLFLFRQTRPVLVDGEGQPLCLMGSTGFEIGTASNAGVYPAGTKAKLKLTPRIDDDRVAEMAKGAKIVIAQYESELWNKAKELTDTLEARDKARQRELFSKIKPEHVKINIK